MTKNELLQIAKLLQIIVEREMQRNTKPLLSEIKRLNTKIALLTESKQNTTSISKSKPVINDIISEISQKESSVKPRSNYLNGIFEDITPFDDDTDDTDSILDYKVQESSDPVSKILNKLQTTDFRKTLQLMEQSADRHNNSQMYR